MNILMPKVGVGLQWTKSTTLRKDLRNTRTGLEPVFSFLRHHNFPLPRWHPFRAPDFGLLQSRFFSVRCSSTVAPHLPGREQPLRRNNLSKAHSIGDVRRRLSLFEQGCGIRVAQRLRTGAMFIST